MPVPLALFFLLVNICAKYVSVSVNVTEVLMFISENLDPNYVLQIKQKRILFINEN